jgi:hypothetical protein
MDPVIRVVVSSSTVLVQVLRQLCAPANWHASIEKHPYYPRAHAVQFRQHHRFAVAKNVINITVIRSPMQLLFDFYRPVVVDNIDLVPPVVLHRIVWHFEKCQRVV